jgi:hypothetical protein
MHDQGGGHVTNSIFIVMEEARVSEFLDQVNNTWKEDLDRY